jgi:hypothetical protein
MQSNKRYGGRAYCDHVTAELLKRGRRNHRRARRRIASSGAILRRTRRRVDRLCSLPSPVFVSAVLAARIALVLWIGFRRVDRVSGA